MKKLLLSISFCIALLCLPFFSSSQILFEENFSSGIQPAGWTNDSAGHPTASLWIFTDVYNRQITGAGFDTSYAIYDSDEGSVNDGFDERTSLTTPAIDISSASVSLYLEFDQNYRELTGPDGSTRFLEISTDGTGWTVIDSGQFNVGFPGNAVHSVFDISSALGSDSLFVRFTWQGTWDWWWAIDNVTVISRQPCTVPPQAGTANSNFTSVCASDSIYLTLSGADLGSDLHHQWQSSSDGTTWTDITDDTMNTAYVVQSAATYYRSNITCNGQTASSLPVLVGMNDLFGCYCVGVFEDGCDILTDVSINTLSNLESGCNNNPNNYIQYPDTGMATTILNADSPYDLTIRSDSGSGNHGAGVWFDFDHNGNFDGADEFYHISDTIPEFSGDIVISIHIPDSVFGRTMMRVRYVYNNAVTQSSFCEDYGFGETEDYIVYILNGTTGLRLIDQNDYTVYPNPANSLLTISSRYNGSSEYSLIDVTGRVSYLLTSEMSNTQLDVSHFTRGIYFLRIETSKGSLVKKIILN